MNELDFALRNHLGFQSETEALGKKLIAVPQPYIKA